MLRTLSRLANNLNGSYISVSLLPNYKKEQIIEMLVKTQQRLPATTSAENLLCGVFQHKLISALFKAAGIDKERKVDSVKSKEIERLADLINDWRFEVLPSDDFKRAQVVAGGINGAEIHEETFESMKIKNLYIIGEAVDIDGDCGGYNLHYAFTSAVFAARDIAK